MEAQEQQSIDATTHVPKFSRYKSIRRANANSGSHLEVENTAPPTDVERSMSRYRKFRQQAQPGKAYTVPALPNNPLLQPVQRANTTRTPPTSGQDQSGTSGLNSAQQEAFDILTGKVDRQKDSLQRQLQEERDRREALAETFRRKQANEDARRVAEKQAALAGRRENKAETPSQRRLHKGTAGQTTFSKSKESQPASNLYKLVDSHSDAKGKLKQDMSKVITGAVAHDLDFDAPKSAVNAGSRTVKVLCNEISLNLSIDPSSTPSDLLLAAKQRLGEGFDPERYVVAESFKQLGLERPLRRYEHIRDVLNSWDRDDQDVLLILPIYTQWDSESLEFENAPKSEPSETSATLYHSQKPGLWDKRNLTLRADGQIVIQKHAGSEAKNICHMSDFDVYMPSASRMKKLRAPRKYCFAIKSQQKSAMFLNTANFVHFICTKDKNLAIEWYRSVHGWRSWYMVDSMGFGKAKPPPMPTLPDRPLIANAENQNIAQSFSPAAQQHSPLTPADRIFPSADLVSSPAAESPRSGTLTRTFNNRGGPPISFPRNMTKEAERSSSRTRVRSSSRTRERQLSVDDDPFAEGGLLGRSYTLRQKAMKVEQEEPSVAPTNVSGTLLNFESTQELPSRGRQGRGVILDHVPTGGLVSAASNADQNQAPFQESQVQISETGGAFNRPGRSATMRQHEEAAFTGGLLSHAGDSQGDRRQGRGVRSGSRDATAPLLDMNEGSAYAAGSLLSKVEDRTPMVQREKVHEVSTKTGEAF